MKLKWKYYDGNPIIKAAKIRQKDIKNIEEPKNILIKENSDLSFMKKQDYFYIVEDIRKGTYFMQAEEFEKKYPTLLPDDDFDSKKIPLQRSHYTIFERSIRRIEFTKYNFLTKGSLKLLHKGGIEFMEITNNDQIIKDLKEKIESNKYTHQTVKHLIYKLEERINFLITTATSREEKINFLTATLRGEEEIRNNITFKDFIRSCWKRITK